MEDRYAEKTEGKKEQEKIKMSDCFITAMFLPKEYDKLMELKKGKMIGYLVLLILLTAVIQYAIPALGAIAGLGGMRSIIMNEIPEFVFQDGTFSFSEKLEQIEEDIQLYILIDTSVEKFTNEDVPRNMIDVIMVSKTNMLTYNNVFGFGGFVQEQVFDYYKDVTITNETVARQAPLIYIILGFLFVLMYGMSFVKYLLMALLYAGILYLLTRTMMTEYTFGKIYKIALFAQSIGVVVVAVTYCLNSTLLILAGNAFHMLVTIMIMNRVVLQKEMDKAI